MVTSYWRSTATTGGFDGRQLRRWVRASGLLEPSLGALAGGSADRRRWKSWPALALRTSEAVGLASPVHSFLESARALQVADHTDTLPFPMVRNCLSSIPFILLISACGSSSTTRPVADDCEPGITRACMCDEGGTTLQECGTDRRWTSCVCDSGSGGTPPSGGAAGDGGEAERGGTAGSQSPSTGGESQAGQPATGGESQAGQPATGGGGGSGGGAKGGAGAGGGAMPTGGTSAGGNGGGPGGVEGTSTGGTTGCECSSGPCCDGCHYYTQVDNHTCAATTNYQCSSASCGGDVETQACRRICQGGTAQCTGEELCDTWTTGSNCTASQLCNVNAAGTDGECTSCANGCSAGACFPDCNPSTDDCCEPNGTRIAWHDPATDLCWENPPNGTTMPFAEAESYCSSLGSGWGLPSIDEIRTIVFQCDTIESGGACGLTSTCTTWSCSQSNCNGCGGVGPTDGCYWSPSLTGDCTTAYFTNEYDPGPNYPWNLDFSDAHFNSQSLGSPFNVRCVRSN